MKQINIQRIHQVKFKMSPIQEMPVQEMPVYYTRQCLFHRIQDMLRQYQDHQHQDRQHEDHDFDLSVIETMIKSMIIDTEEDKTANKLHDNQLKTGNKILSNMLNDKHWVVLLAYPQSGKTVVFCFVACEMLRQKKVKKVVMMCGCADNELKAQLNKTLNAFITNYRRYLEANYEMSGIESEQLVAMIRENIEILWSHQLKKNNGTGNVRDTLFIWDESHTAQDVRNLPHKYLKSHGITADGNVENLNGERNNYMLSVSATPMSELCDLVHETQTKELVIMESGSGYIGPMDFIQANSIIQFDPRKTNETILQAMREHGTTRPKYCIIRLIGEKVYTTVQYLTRHGPACGWNKIHIFDSETRNAAIRTNSNEMKSMDDLANAPTENTVIIIRGMCRMGKRVPKDHIAFVMETSVRSNTDTVVQGLMGRMFGYDSNTNIKIYISKYNSIEEIERYDEMLKSIDNTVRVVPKKAKNLIADEVDESICGHWRFNSPILIRGLSQETITNRNHLIPAIKNALFNAEHQGNPLEITNHNTEYESRKIKEQIGEMTVNNTNEFKTVIHRMVNSQGHVHISYSEMPTKIINALNQRSRMPIGSSPGCGFESNDIDKYQVNVWVINTSQYERNGLHLNDIVIHTRTLRTLLEGEPESDIPRTTKKETFSTREEDESVNANNGGYNIYLPLETSTNENAMKQSIMELIRLSQQPGQLIRPNYVTSTYKVDDQQQNDDDNSNNWNGIVVNNHILTSLTPGGRIYSEIERTFGLKLIITRPRGRRPANMGNMQRLVKIQWIL